MIDAKQRLEELDTVFSALAHASRRHILLVICFRGGALSAGDIAGRFHHAWPTISRHLRVLERAQLLTAERDGRTRYYHINTKKLGVIREWLNWFEPPNTVNTIKTPRGSR